MKPHIPVQLLKALMLSAVAYTVQAGTPVGEASRGSVLFVFHQNGEPEPGADAQDPESVFRVDTEEGETFLLPDYVYFDTELRRNPMTDAGPTPAYRSRVIDKRENYLERLRRERRLEAAAKLGPDRLRALDALERAIEAMDGAEFVEDGILVEHRGKGVVRRTQTGYYKWPIGFWNDEAAYFGHHVNSYLYLNDGYTAVWVGTPQKIYYKPSTGNTLTANTTANTTSHTSTAGGAGAAYAPAYRGGSYSAPSAPVQTAPAAKVLNQTDGATLTVKGSPTLTGNWVLDLRRTVELDYSSASAPLALNNGTLNIKKGDGLVLNLSGRWDGESTGSFDLVTLGSKGTLKFNGGKVYEGSDYLSSLGGAIVRYTDADGNTRTLDLSTADGSNGLSYSIKVNNGTLSFVVSEPAQTTGLSIGQGTDTLQPGPSAIITGASSLTWTAGSGNSLTWSNGGAWNTNTFNDVDSVTFKANSGSVVDNETVTLGGDVKTGTFKVEGMDNYTFALENHKITIGDTFSKTGNGKLVFADGSIELASGKTIKEANNIELRNVTFTDKNEVGSGNTVNITDHGTFKMAGGTASIVKLNANNDYNYKETHVILTDGAHLSITRDSSIENSGLEAAYMEISRGATLTMPGRDSLKVEHLWMDGTAADGFSGATLNLNQSLLRANSAKNVYFPDVDVILKNGATINNGRADGQVFDLTAHSTNAAKYSPNLNLTLQGDTSYITGSFSLSHLQNMVLETPDSYLSIGNGTTAGSLNLTNTITASLTFSGSTFAVDSDYTFIHAADGSSISVNGAALEAGVDYLTALKIGTVTVGGTVVTGNADYEVQVVKSGNNLVLRVLDANRGPSATAYVWSNADGASMNWSSAGWHEQIWNNGSAVRFISDGVEGTAATSVAVRSDVTVTTMEVSGEDGFSFNLGSNTITAETVTKSGEGAMSLSNGTVDAQSVAISGGTVELATGSVLNTTSLSLTGGTLDISGSTLTYTPGLSIAGGSVVVRGTGDLVTPSVSVTDGGSLAIDKRTISFANGVSADNGSITLTANSHLTTSALTLGNGSTFSASGGSLTVTGDLAVSDSTFTLNNGTVLNAGTFTATDSTVSITGSTTHTITGAMAVSGGTMQLEGVGGSNARLTADSLSVSNGGSLRLSRANITATNGAVIDGGSMTMVDSSKLITDTVTVKNGGSLSMSVPSSLPGVDGNLAVTLADGGVLTNLNAAFQTIPVKNLTVAGSGTSYLTGLWALNIGATTGLTFQNDGSALTIGHGEDAGSLNITTSANGATLQLGAGVLQQGKTDYTLIHVADNGTLTYNSNELVEYRDYLSAFKLNTVKAGDTTLAGNADYDVHLMLVGNDVVLRVIDKRHAATEYVWSNDKGADMGWSSLSWDSGSYYADDTVRPTVRFISDGIAGASATTVTLKSTVTGGDMQVSGEDDFTFQQGSYYITLDNLEKTGSGTLTFEGATITGSANADKRNITVNHTVDISEGTFVLGEGMRLTTETINVRDGARVVLGDGATIPPLSAVTGDLNLSNGAILHSASAGVRSFAANNIDIMGSTVYWTGDWRLELGSVSTMTFGDDGHGGGSFVTIGTATQAGSIDLTAASTYSELQLTASNWDATNERTDYVLFHRSENGSMTIAGNAIDEHKDYIKELKLDNISVIIPATEDTELERVIGNFIGNAQYNTFIVRVGDDLVLRIVDKDHSVKDGGYSWHNNKDGYGDAMAWSVIGWQNEAWFSGSDVNFVSDNTEGTATTTVDVKSDVTAGAINVSGEDNFTFNTGANKITATTLNKSGSGELAITGTTPIAAETVNITGGTVHLTGGTTTGGSGASLALDTLNITNGTLVLDAGSQISIYTPGASKNLAINLDGATIRNNGADALPFRGWDDANRIVTITPTGTTSHLVGKWKVSSNFTLDASSADFTAPIIGGDADLASELLINRAGITINLGDKWDGVNSMEERVKLFEVGGNGAITLDTTNLTGDRYDCISLLTGLKVNYTGGEGGSADVAKFNDAYFADLTYENGSLYLNLVKKGEFVWANTDGAAMTWSKSDKRWGVMEGSSGIAYREYEHVRFTGDGDTLNVATTNITINGIGNPASDDDKTQNTFYIGNFTVEGEDNFIFHISGRMQMTGFEKHGSGTATLICDTKTYRPVFKVLEGDFTINGGTVDAAETQLEVEDGRLVIDGSSGDARLIAKFNYTGVDSLNLKNATVLLTGAGASMEVYKAGNSDTGGKRTSVTVEKGARLTSETGSISMQDLVVRSGGTVTASKGATIKSRTYTIESGGVLEIGKTGADLQDAFTPYSPYDPVAINLKDGGVLRNISTSAPLRLNVVKNRASTEEPWRYSRTTITLAGSASVLEGNWVLDASVDTIIRFADADTSALSIQNGTLDIINAGSATETGAITFDLTGMWDGATPITQRLFRTISGGNITMDGAAMAAGDVTSQFRNVYVRYGTGADQIINLSSASETAGSSSHYQLLWQNGSLFFTLAGQDENGPFIWRHSYEQEYAPTDGSLSELKLTWKNGGVWRPDSETFGGPSGVDHIPAAIYKNGYAVSFVGDTDGVVDEVYVSIDGKVAPGDSTQGEAGIRVTGADNYHLDAARKTDAHGLVFSVKDGADTLTVYRFGNEEDGYFYAELNEDGTAKDTHYTEADKVYVAAEITDHRTENGSILPTTLSKSGSGSLIIGSTVALSYTGRTEILEGLMQIDGTYWAPQGIITVAEGATLQVGNDRLMGDRRSNILSLGANMVDNNGFVHTNILLTNGSTVTGEGLWKATYFKMDGGTTFRAGAIELQDVANPAYGRASLVADSTDITVTGYVDAANQNITLMNRSFMTVEGKQGKTSSNAAVEVDNIIISGEGSGLNFTGGGTLRAQNIDLTHGSTLGLSKALEHVDNEALTVTFGYGATLRNNGSPSIVLNPNANADFSLIVKAKNEPNYFEGNWTVDLSHPFLLDYSYFDNDTTVVPLVVHDGTMTLANADKSLGAGGSNFVFRADGLKYDTLELMTVGERGKIALTYTENGKTVNTILSNKMDYFSHLDSMGYWFHVDAKGNDTLVVDPETGAESGWRYVDLVPYKENGVTYYRGLNGTRYTEAEFMAYTGLENGLNFKLLYESNVLSLVIAPDGPIGNREYYFWSGYSGTGSYKGPYGTWTRHNSVELSPWYGDDIFQNGYLTIFADVDLSGRKIGVHTVEIENAVATGSHALKAGTRPGFTNAGIYFGNHSVAGYTLQSDAYHGSGYIADISEKDITKITIDGGYVEIKTSNTYGGKLSQSATASDYATIVKSSFVTADTCAALTKTVTVDGEETVQTVLPGNNLYEMNVQQARAAGLVNYSRYAYAYKDETGVHFITSNEYQTGKYADKNPERVYITQRTDGSNMWSVRGETIPMTVKQDHAVVYETEIRYGYAFTETDTQGMTRLHFVSAKDWQDGTYADKNVMEVVITPTSSDRVSWSISGTHNGSDFQESVAQSRVDMTLVEKSTSTYAFAYKGSDNRYQFITEQDYQLWNAWTEAPEATKQACMDAFKAANKDLAAYAAANPDVLVQLVSVVRTVDSSNPAEIRWTIGGEGGQVVNFQQFPFNQVYAYKLADGSVHVLSDKEYNTWVADKAAFGHDVERVGVFGPVNNEWGLYTINEDTGNKEKWGTIYERPQVNLSADAYLRTTEQYSGYAYLTTSEGSSDLNHAHLISAAEYNAWNAWLAINGDDDPIGKDAAFTALQNVSPELAALAASDPSIKPEPVKLARYANEQTYRVTGAAIHDNLSTRGVANNFSYAYTTNVEGRQEINMLTEAQFKAWQTYNAVVSDASATIEQKDAAFAAFSSAVGDELASNIKNSAVIAPERVDLAYFSQTDAATGTTSNYWAIRGDNINGRKDSLVGYKTYGAAFVCVYQDTAGNYHAISQEDYQNWIDGKVDSISDSAAKAFAGTHSGVETGVSYTSGSETYTLTQADYDALKAGKYSDISASGLITLARTNSGSTGYAYQDAEGKYHTLTEADFNAWTAGNTDDIANEDAKAFAQANTGAAPVYAYQGEGDHKGYLSQADYAALQAGDIDSISGAGLLALAETNTASGSFAYVDGDGAYRTISAADYTAWKNGDIAAISDTDFKAYATAHRLVNPVVVNMSAESTIHIVNGEPTSDTSWTLTTPDGATLSFANVGGMDALNGKVYSYAYTQLDSLGRTHVHFISAEDFAAGTYASHNPLLVTLSNNGAGVTYSWDVRGTSANSSIDDNVSTRTLANNYVYAYKQGDGVGFVTQEEYRAWQTCNAVLTDASASDDQKAAAYEAFSTAVGSERASIIRDSAPERVDLTFCSSTDDYGVETTWWQLKGATIDTTKSSMAGIETYGAAFLYAYKDAQGKYQFLTQEDFLSWKPEEHDGAQALRVEMIAESVIGHTADGTPTSSVDWLLRVPGTDETFDMTEAGGMGAIADRVYAYAYRGEDGTLQFITAADYAAGIYADKNPECVALSMSVNISQPWSVTGGGIDVIVDVSDIPTNAGDDVYTDIKTEHYTYVVVVRNADDSVSGQFISERDLNDGKFPENALRNDDGTVNVQRLTLVQQADGKWFVPEKGYTMAMETLEVTVDTQNFFGYGYYDEQGRLHLTTQDTCYADNGSGASGLEGKASPLGNTQLIRLAYDEKTGKWYTPGVLIASNEHALGTSEVLIGYGSRLLATTNLYLTSLTMESGANVIARQNLDINKPLTVTSGSYFETDGTLTVANITVEKGSHFVTNNVKATNVTIQSGALWDLSSGGQSTLDISDRLIIYGGSEITGNALMRDGMLELFSGSAENPYVTITGSLKIGVDATLDLTKLMPEGEQHHYRSPLKVSEGGRLELEPHDGVMLSMDQVNHMLQDHDGEIPQSRHVMHIATLGAGANFYITNTTDYGDGNLASVEVPLPTTDLTDYDNLASNVELAEGLGYLLNSTLIRRHIETGPDAGLDEVVLHIGVKEDAPAYVWDGVYNGRDATDNDNLWCMYNGADDMGLDGAGFAWSGNAVYGDPTKVNEEGQYNNWGREVYFLEVGFDKNSKAAFTYHYVNENDKDAKDLTYRAKYVDISGPVWSNKITVDVDRLYDLTLEQYLRNVGYLFYTSDGTGTITDCYVHTETGAMVPTTAMSADMAAQNGYVLQQTNIVKAGTGVLTLSTENSFSGTVYLNSGSVFATNEKALGTSHVKMMDQTGLYINFLFEMKGDSNYRNPVLPNEITVWGGENFEEAAERAVEGSRIISVTVGYNPISVIDVMCDLQGGDTTTMREESTSRHWRTLAITGPIHGGKNTEITLQGYTSYTGGICYTSMFHVYGSEGLTDFAGTIKLQNYRNLSPAAYSGSGSFMDDTNNQRGTGAVELMLSDGTLQYATLDLTRANVLASYTKENGEQGFGRRQTPTHIVLLRGDSAVAGMNADFLGTIVRAVRDENGVPHSGQTEILVATQGQELTSVRTIAVGNYTFSLHSEEMEDFVYSGVLGGKYAYAGQGSGTIPEAGEDSTSAKVSNGMISVVHTGQGAQYVHTGYLQDLTIGNEAVGSYQKATGGTMGFHYLDLQGNLTLHSGATLKLDVDDCVRTANADGSQQEVHWDESAFSSSNVELHNGKHATIITSLSTPGMVNVYDKKTNAPVSRMGEIPVGSTIEGSLTIDAGSHLDFFSRGIEPLAMPEGASSPDLVKTLTDTSHHTEAGAGLNAPKSGYLLDMTGQLVLKGEVHVDFAGVEFTSAHNGMTYYLARAQQGIIGTVTQQTISLGNGYYGIVRGLQTYQRDALELILPGNNNLTFAPAADIKSETDTRLSMDTLTSVSVNLLKKEGSSDYYFNYTRNLTDGTVENGSITLTQVTGNIYSYEVGGTAMQTTVSTNLAAGEGSMLATLNLLPLAYEDAAGYIIMTVTNTPPRVWFNTDNVISPTADISLLDANGKPIAGVMVTPNGTRFINKEDSGVTGDNYVHFGDVAVDTLWTNHGPTAHSWIDEHDVYGLGCRVQFNKYGTARYLGAGDVRQALNSGLIREGEGEASTVVRAAGDLYTRGGIDLVYNKDKDEYGMFVPVQTDNGTKEVWRGMVAELYGEQFDIVELEGDVQARSIFVDCETGIHPDATVEVPVLDEEGRQVLDALGNPLTKIVPNPDAVLVNSPRRQHVNYWFRSADVDDAGRIGDIEVTDVNHEALTAKVYDVKIGQILAVSLEKTGSGYLRISTHNSYSGGTYLKAGTLIIDCDDALGKASARQDAGGGDGALHAYDGSSLFLNYVGNNDTTVFSNKINVYANTAALAEHQQAGFTISNGINLNGTAGGVHFVLLDGAIIAADPDAVITLSGVIVAENSKSYRDYTSFTISNLENYSGVVRLDSNFASNAAGEGIVNGIVVDSNGQIIDYVRCNDQYYLPGSSTAMLEEEEGAIIHFYDEATRKIFHYLDSTDANGVVTRTTLTRKDIYYSTKDSSVTYQPGDPQLFTGGEVGLRITGSTLGEAIVDLSLNNAYHNALVLDMAKKTNSNYVLGGVRGLVGGELTYVSEAEARATGATTGWQGYNSNVVSAKKGERAILSLDVAYGDALYAGTVGYGYYHATEGENVGLVHPSSAMMIEKNGNSTQSIFSARLDGLTINQGNIQFVKDLILSGKLSIAKETQLIIGTPGTTTTNFNVANGAPYSIVVQGEGILALGGKHTKDYKTTKSDGGDFTVTTKWSDFTTDIRDYSEDMTPNALFRGGTLTAITDVGTSISARFENSFTIDTSHYYYEDASILKDEGMEISTVMPDTHTITLSGRLYGTGLVTVTGGGTLVIDATKMDVYDTKEKKVVGQMVGYNAFAGTRNMLIRVQDATTLSINKDSALAYYGDGYSEQLSGTKHQLVANGSKGWQGASTLEVCDNSRAVVEQGIHAQIAAARFVDNGVMEVASADPSTPLAVVGTWSWSPSTGASTLAEMGGEASAPALGGNGSTPDVGAAGDNSVAGPVDTLNIVNVEVSSVKATDTEPAKATFVGIIPDSPDQNAIYHDAYVEIGEGVQAEMSDLTLGSVIRSTMDESQQDHTLASLKSQASLKLDNVVVQNYAVVCGLDNYTGSTSADGKEVVSLENAYVVAELGKNLLRPGEDFVFTGEPLESRVDYTQGNTANYTYSENSFCLDVGQDVFTLTNFQNCVITGGEGDLTILLSQEDYNELIQYGARRLVGIYMPGVAVITDGVSENLIRFAITDARGTAINNSVFWVTARADGEAAHNGTVFYIDTEVIPEPATSTLSLLALAALCARRRRKVTGK